MARGLSSLPSPHEGSSAGERGGQWLQQSDVGLSSPPHLACHASVHPSGGRHGQLRILSHLAGLPVLLEKGRTLGSQTWDAGLHRLVPLDGPQVEVNAVMGSGPTCSTQLVSGGAPSSSISPSSPHPPVRIPFPPPSLLFVLPSSNIGGPG